LFLRKVFSNRGDPKKRDEKNMKKISVVISAIVVIVILGLTIMAFNIVRNQGKISIGYYDTLFTRNDDYPYYSYYRYYAVVSVWMNSTYKQNKTINLFCELTIYTTTETHVFTHNVTLTVSKPIGNEHYSRVWGFLFEETGQFCTRDDRYDDMSNCWNDDVLNTSNRTWFTIP
jgi:hypothetical protein